MFTLPAGDAMAEGKSDETALSLPGVTVQQFESLLDFLYFRFEFFLNLKMCCSLTGRGFMYAQTEHRRYCSYPRELDRSPRYNDSILVREYTETSNKGVGAQPASDGPSEKDCVSYQV